MLRVLVEDSVTLRRGCEYQELFSGIGVEEEVLPGSVLLHHVLAKNN